jgi:hypothetical protein
MAFWNSPTSWGGIDPLSRRMARLVWLGPEQPERPELSPKPASPRSSDRRLRVDGEGPGQDRKSEDKESGMGACRVKRSSSVVSHCKAARIARIAVGSGTMRVLFGPGQDSAAWGHYGWWLWLLELWLLGHGSWDRCAEE